MFSWLQRIFSRDTEPAEPVALAPEDVVAYYERERGDAMAAARDRAGTHREAVLDALADVEVALQELDGFENDLTAIEDVMENVVTTRLRRLDAFDPPEDIAAFHAAARDLVGGLLDATQKEQAVIARVGEPAKQLFDTMRAAQEQVAALETFLDEEYAAVTRRDELQELVAEWQGYGEELDRLQDEIADIELETPRSRIDDIEQELAALADDPRQEEMDALEDEIEVLQERRNRLRARMNGAVSDMSRGMKKVLYAARNGESDLAREHVSVLDTVNEQGVFGEDVPAAADICAAADAVAHQLTDVDLGERQRQKFREGAEQLQRLEAVQNEIAEVTEEIASLEDELAGYTLAEEREEFVSKRDRIEEEIAERAKRRKQLRKQVRDVEASQAAVLEELASVLNDVFAYPVQVVEDGEPAGEREDLSVVS